MATAASQLSSPAGCAVIPRETRSGLGNKEIKENYHGDWLASPCLTRHAGLRYLDVAQKNATAASTEASFLIRLSTKEIRRIP